MKTRHGTIASGLTQLGQVGIVIACDCGHVSSVEMDESETKMLIALLQTNLSLAARARHHGVPFIHDEGSA